MFERPKGSGIWWARSYDEQGREHREKVGPKGLALEVYRKRKTEVAERRFFPERFRARDEPLLDVIRDFMARKGSKRLDAKGAARYARCWSNAPETKGKALREVQPHDIERYRERRSGAGAGGSTINREMSFLRAVYNDKIAAVRRDRHALPLMNPVLPEHFYPENTGRVRFLSDEEEAQLRAELPDPVDWALVEMAMLTGLDRGRQFRLEWETDVNFEARTVRGLRRKGRRRELVPYFVPMNDDLLRLLRELPSRCRSRWVFPNPTGTGPLDPHNWMARVFLPAVELAGIEGFCWRDLRHTFATRLRTLAKLDTKSIGDLLGHTSGRMAERYAHLTPSHLFDAVQRMVRPADGDRTGTTTGTDPEARRKTAQAVDGKEQAVHGQRDDGRCRDRTCDPRLVRPMLSR